MQNNICAVLCSNNLLHNYVRITIFVITIKQWENSLDDNHVLLLIGNQLYNQ